MHIAHIGIVYQANEKVKMYIRIGHKGYSASAIIGHPVLYVKSNPVIS